MQEAVTVMYTNDVFDDIDFLLLYKASNKKNPALPYWKYDRFDITRLTDEECKADFRFGITKLPLLEQTLKIPESFVCRNGTVAGGMEGLCILLQRYAYPCRLSDLIPMFGRSVPELSEIVSEVSAHIFNTHGYLLRTLNQPWFQPDQLQRFADATVISISLQVEFTESLTMMSGLFAVIVLSVLTGISHIMVMLSLLCITVSGACWYHLSVISIA